MAATTRPRFAPFCRGDRHPQVLHDARLQAGCECPCHGGEGPWWSDVRVSENGSSKEATDVG